MATTAQMVTYVYILLITGALIVLPVGSEISYTLYWLEIKHRNFTVYCIFKLKNLSMVKDLMFL